MTTTTTLRNWWAPACKGPLSRVGLYGSGWVTVRSPIVPAVVALNSCLIAWRYVTRRDDTGAYNCRAITGGTEYSLHAYGIAVDINWQSNPYGRRLITDMPFGMVQAIKAIRTKNGKQVWRWGGDYRGNKDAMHFEIVCHPNDLATGIDPSTLPGANEEDDMPLTNEDLSKIADAVWNRQLVYKGAGLDAPASLAIGDIFHHARRGAIISGADVDEVAIAQEILAHLDPEKIAAAIPLDLADKVADVLAARLKD